MAEETEEGQHKGLRYMIRLLIKHPSIDPATITAKLGLAPTGMTRRSGAPRETPKGNPLPGLWHQSTWSHHIDIRDKRSFFDEVVQLLELLEPNAAFLSEIIDSGGAIEMTVDLFGERNIGDSLGADHLRRLGALRINLGVEVF